MKGNMVSEVVSLREKLAFWNIYSSYATYYFGKVNLGIVIPALLATFANLSLYTVGLVSSGFFFAYALGQFLHGQISEKYNPFVYISIGLIGSAIANAFLGFCGGFFILLFVGEVVDGLFQSMGWSSCVRANSLIQKKHKREKSSVVLGTSYQLGNSIAWLISAFVVARWGWQAGFWVASFLLFVRGITLWLSKPEIKIEPKRIFLKQIKKTLTPPIVFGGIGLCLLNMVRFGVISWIPLYLFQSENLVVADMGKVGLKVFLLPVAGILGTLIYNKIKADKDILAIISCVLLSFSFIAFMFSSGFLAVVMLLIGSFFLYGPHVFLVTTLPTRYADEKIVASSTGFIDGMGYIGTVLIGLIVPFLLVTMNAGWHSVFILWCVLSLIVSISIGISYKCLKKQKMLQ